MTPAQASSGTEISACTSFRFLCSALARLQACLSDRTYTKFDFELVDAPRFLVVVSSFRWRKTSEDFILPSLVLFFEEPLQLGFWRFLFHEGPRHREMNSDNTMLGVLTYAVRYCTQ